MRRRNFHVFVLCAFVIIVLSAIMMIFLEGQIDGRRNNFGMYDGCIDSLAGKLVTEKPLAESISEKEQNTTTLIYVLGGNQENLILRFRKASALYHQNFSKKILILSRPGITEFSPDLGRNLTNDEWAIRELEILKVKKEDIEPVFVKKGIFGTLNEAKYVSDIVQKKGCNRLILVTSDYHTRRVIATFSRYLSNKSFELYVYGSDDTKNFSYLLSEYIKLYLYNNIISEIYRIKKSDPNRNSFFENFADKCFS